VDARKGGGSARRSGNEEGGGLNSEGQWRTGGNEIDSCFFKK